MAMDDTTVLRTAPRLLGLFTIISVMLVEPRKGQFLVNKFSPTPAGLGGGFLWPRCRLGLGNSGPHGSLPTVANVRPLDGVAEAVV